jgi:hypothetical protein
MDIIKSIDGPRGYLKHLELDAAARENFAAFMKESIRHKNSGATTTGLSDDFARTRPRFI